MRFARSAGHWRLPDRRFDLSGSSKSACDDRQKPRYVSELSRGTIVAVALPCLHRRKWPCGLVAGHRCHQHCSGGGVERSVPCSCTIAEGMQCQIQGCRERGNARRDELTTISPSQLRQTVSSFVDQARHSPRGSRQNTGRKVREKRACTPASTSIAPTRLPVATASSLDLKGRRLLQRVQQALEG